MVLQVDILMLVVLTVGRCKGKFFSGTEALDMTMTPSCRTGAACTSWQTYFSNEEVVFCISFCFRVSSKVWHSDLHAWHSSLMSFHLTADHALQVYSHLLQPCCKTSHNGQKSQGGVHAETFLSVGCASVYNHTNRANVVCMHIFLPDLIFTFGRMHIRRVSSGVFRQGQVIKNIWQLEDAK